MKSIRVKGGREASPGRLAGMAFSKNDGVVHDLQNILWAIRCMADCLTGELPPGKHSARTIAESIRGAAERCQDLLLVMTTPAQAATREEIDIVSLIDEIVSWVVCSNRLGKKKITASHESPKTVVAGDGNAICSALMNIILNAVEAIPNGGTVRVESCLFKNPGRSHSSGRYATIKVTDSGAGITPENLSRIFEPGFSTKGRITKRPEGLGLWSARECIIRNGGTIDVASRVSGGTTFWIRLPVYRAGMDLRAT